MILEFLDVIYFNIEKYEKNKYSFVILEFLDVTYFNIEKYERY